MTTPSPIENTTIIPPREAKEYLAKRDIDADCFATALTEGLAQRQNCQVFHPVTAPGYYQWSETNFSIRKFHCESNNWKMENPDNRPLLVHVDNQIKFVAAAGNSATGLREAAPGLARKKGISTIQSVNASNQLQIGLGVFTSAVHSPDARHTPPPGEGCFCTFMMRSTRNSEANSLARRRSPKTEKSKHGTLEFCSNRFLRNSLWHSQIFSGPRTMTLTSQSHERAETNSARISPSRITVARLRRGLTKAELAAHLDVAPATLSRWENEGPPPSHTEFILERLETALGFSAGYFLSPELEVPSMDSTLFRAGSRATLRQKSVAVASGANARTLLAWLRRNFNFPEPNLPDLSGFTPAEAARHARTIWQLGDKPVPNSVQLAESLGIAVMGLPPSASAVDAFSMWDGEQPFIFLARRRTPEGARFDLAHELGHLLLHSSDEPRSGTREEDEANRFAADFLIPPGIVHAHLRLHTSLDDILQLKTALKVSAMAMLRAAYQHGKLSEREYHSHLATLSARGFRTDEPGSTLQYERSRVFDYVLSPEGGANIESIADETQLPPQDLHALMLSTQPHTVSSSTSTTSAPARPTLRVVR